MIYTVTKGDTLEKISQDTQVPPEKIIYDNQLENGNRLVEGQALLLLKEGESGDYGTGLSVGLSVC